jgi:hypothetical protein
MKAKFNFFLLLYCFFSCVNATYSQCTDAPEELFRLRLKSNGGAYGNPYTMFDRRKPYGKDFIAWDELGKIRARIIDDFNKSAHFPF